MNVAGARIVNPPDDSYEGVRQKYNNSDRKVVLKDGLVVGIVVTGDIEKSGIIFALMKEGVNIDGFKQALVAEDFGLASLPEEIWRPQVEMPPSMLASLTVSVEQPEEMVMGE